MSEVKHTPLPWRIGAACNGNWIEAGEPGSTIYQEMIDAALGDTNAA